MTIEREPFNPPAVVELAEAASLAELAGRINEEHSLAEGSMRDCLTHAQEAGRMLTEAKERLHHGAWLPWVKTNLSISPRTAQKYMRVAERWKEIEANAPPTALLSYDQALEVIAEKSDRVPAERDEGNEPAAPGANATPESHLGSSDSAPAKAQRVALLAAHDEAEELTWADLVKLRPELESLLHEALLVDGSAPGYCWEEAWFGPFGHASRQNAGDPRSFLARVAALVGWYAPDPPILKDSWAWELATDVLAASLPRCPTDCPCGSGGRPHGSPLSLTLPARQAYESRCDLIAARIRQESARAMAEVEAR